MERHQADAADKPRGIPRIDDRHKVSERLSDSVDLGKAGGHLLQTRP
jgi:hypothetical protein